MEDSSAIYRVPVEIWSKILSFALQTWLLPGTGDSFLDDVLLFTDECESNMEYIRVEGIRRQLRAVCSTWRSIVEDAGVEFTISNFLNSTFPSESHLSRAKRIEFPSTFKCYCLRCHYTFSDDRNAPSDRHYKISDISPRPNYQFRSSFKPLNAQIILLNSFGGQVASYLEHASQLTAFGGGFSLLHDGRGLKFHSFCEKLTHLEVTDLSPTNMAIALCLPQLRFLHLKLRMGDARYNPPGYIPLKMWALPSLVSLIVDGIVGGIHYDYLLQFLRNHSTHIENLITRYDITIDDELCLPLTIDIPHLRQYPRLKLVGFSMHALDGEYGKLNLGDASERPLLVPLLLTDTTDRFKKSQRWIQATATRILRLCTPPISLFSKVVLIQTWDELIRHWDSEKKENWHSGKVNARFSSTWPLINALYSSPVSFFDRDGVGLQEGSGLKVVERLGAL